MRLDSVQIGVDDLDAGARAYTLLLGLPPATRTGGMLRFQLQRGAVEVAVAPPGVQSIRFACDPNDPVWPDAPAAFNGLRVHTDATAAPAAPACPAGAVEAIDHVVVRSPNPERALALWRDRLGLRLALDRAFPERGLRLLFFRSGGITLEFACPLPAPVDAGGDDQFYGVSYRVGDLAARRQQLLAAGVDVSPIRSGQRPGTTVASVRSGTAGVPTLLIAATAPEGR